MDTLSKKLANEEAMLKDKRSTLMDEVKEEKQQILDQAREEIDEIIASINQDKMELHDIAKIKKRLNDLQDAPEDIKYNEEIATNDYIEIPSLNISGRVIRINNGKAHVTSDAGLSFDVEVEKLHKTHAPSVSSVKKRTSSIDLSLDTKIGLELNMIGMHVDEAQNALIKYIDSCRLKRFKQVRIIHGYGSGALRKMTREYLDKQKDLSYRAGDGSEGGGGATVVIFK